MRTLGQLVVISLGGALVGLLVNVVEPGGLVLGRRVTAQAVADSQTCAAPEVQSRVDVAEALRLFDSAAVTFADARASEEYAAGHIAEALHLPCSADAPEWLEGIPRSRTVVVYGSGGSVDQVAQALTAAGYRDVLVMESGFSAWRDLGGASQAGECHGCQ
jgi:rhodanese-related sulfurtransferase